MTTTSDQNQSSPLAQMRHTLRTPLNHIIGYSEMLLEEAAESGRKELEPGLHRVHEDARKLLGLINNLLAHSGREAEAVDLASVRGEFAPPLERIIATAEALKRQVGELTLKGFHRPITAYNVLRLKG